jgi:alpha-ribazole phosphatase
MRLHLVRHLAPLVDAGVCYGRTDLATDPAAQILALPALRAALPRDVPIYSSPLQRCLVLAEALAGNAVIVDTRLAELDFGSWEMQRWDAIPRTGIDAWAEDVAAYRPGGGESVDDMAARIAGFYADILQSNASEAIVVCHAGAIRLLSARAAGMDPQQMARAAAAHPHRIAYGEIVTLTCV